MKKLVIIPGGFHPFHAGHMALYNSALQAFPEADVYVAATADTKERPFPFAVKQKLAKLAGIPEDRFVQVKNPFVAQEIVSKYDPEDTELIFVRSDKDRQSQPQPGGTRKDGKPSYLQPYSSRDVKPMSQHGYMAYLPTVEFGPGIKSASEIRDLWPTLDNKKKLDLIQDLYPATKSKAALGKTVVRMLDNVLNQKTVDENQGWAATLERKHEKDHDKTDDHLDPLKASEKDPELRNALLYAKQHYQQHRGDVLTAYMKWVQRSLAHSEKEDRIQNEKIRTLDQHLHDLRTQLAQTNSAPIEETTFVDDPDRGTQIRPEGGMGTWNEPSLVSNLARKFSDMVHMVKEKNYSGLYHVIYTDGAMRAMVKALADLEVRQQKSKSPKLGEETGVMAGTPAVGGMRAGYQARENQPIMDYVEEHQSHKK